MQSPGETLITFFRNCNRSEKIAHFREVQSVRQRYFTAEKRQERLRHHEPVSFLGLPPFTAVSPAWPVTGFFPT